MYNQYSKVNSVLETQKMETLNYVLWSSTENGSNYAYLVGFSTDNNELFINSTYDKNFDMSDVRAVYTF